MMDTPSSLYAKARNRSPKHDAMQAEMLAFLQSRELSAVPGSTILRRHVEVEMPIVVNGRAVSFSDLAEVFEFDTGRVIALYEIKPSIESVGGIIRQCKAMRVLAEGSDLQPALISCAAVVPWNDPMLPDLKAAYRHVWSWGIKFEMAEEFVE